MTNVPKERTVEEIAETVYLKIVTRAGIPVEHIAEALQAERQKRDQELQKARESWLREEIVRLEGMDEYIAVKDNDSHRYQIPKHLKYKWDEFCEIPSDDEASWDVPEWAERIDGMPVSSFKQTIIDRYQSELDQLSDKPICKECGGTGFHPTDRPAQFCTACDGE